jgi:hypothetical protein
MIIEKQAQEVSGQDPISAHKIEILCPKCNRDIDDKELVAGFCNSCNADLSEPVQHAEVHATSIPLFGITF